MQLQGLNTKFLGRNSIYYKEIDSTQKEIWKQYEQGIINGTLVMADHQTSGIGTHGRIWHTDEENNIAFSFLVKTNCKSEKLQGLTLKIAQIIIEILENKYGVKLSIKEPNDIVYNGKKIGGILTQTKVSNEKVKCLVIGIGINTMQENFAEDIKEIASSIKKEFGVEVKREEVIAEFCNKFEKEIESRGII